MNFEKRIRAADVLSMGLEEIIGVDKNGLEVCRKVKNYLKAHLFSAYGERKLHAALALSDLLETNVEIGIMYGTEQHCSYIRIGSSKKWIPVDNYLANSPILEEEPTPEDRQMWIQRIRQDTT